MRDLDLEKRCSPDVLNPRLRCYTGSLLDEPDEQGLTVLHHAAKQGSPRLVQMLLEGGASAHVVDAHGWMPEHVARIEDNIAHADVIRAHLQRGGEEPDPVAESIAKAKSARRRTNMMASNKTFRAAVHRWYKKYDSSRGDSGGWPTESIEHAGIHHGLEAWVRTDAPCWAWAPPSHQEVNRPPRLISNKMGSLSLLRVRPLGRKLTSAISMSLCPQR